MEEWVALIAAIGIAAPALITSVITFLNFRESKRNGRQLDLAAKEVSATHTIVNSQRTAMETEISWLKERINEMHNELIRTGKRENKPL